MDMGYRGLAVTREALMVWIGSSIVDNVRYNFFVCISGKNLGSSRDGWMIPNMEEEATLLSFKIQKGSGSRLSIKASLVSHASLKSQNRISKMAIYILQSPTSLICFPLTLVVRPTGLLSSPS